MRGDARLVSDEQPFERPVESIRVSIDHLKGPALCRAVLHGLIDYRHIEVPVDSSYEAVERAEGQVICGDCNQVGCQGGHSEY